MVRALIFITFVEHLKIFMQEEFKPGLFNPYYSINLKGQLMGLTVPKVMGIINLTPDSFYIGSQISSKEALKKRVEQFIEEGVDFIDVGAYSSRPGANHIDEKEELRRLEPALQVLRKNYPQVVVSVDTFRASVAKTVVQEYGVQIINDISAGLSDKNMLKTISELGVPYIMMHMKGTPQTMQDNPVYENLMKEIIAFISERILVAREAGIKDIIIDPGFGFGKSLDHNYQLLQNLELMRIVDCPMLIGLSRKSMIYRVLETSPDEALTGSIALNTVALLKGAKILRVHDVKEAVQTVKLFTKMMDFPVV